MAACSTGSAVEVRVKLTSGKTTNLTMKKDDRIIDVRDKIAAEEKIGDVRRLLLKYTGKVLKTLANLHHLGVCKETVLKAEIVTVKDWTITVDILDDSKRSVVLAIENVSLMRDIYRQLLDKEGIKPGYDGWTKIMDASGNLDFDHSTPVLDVGIKDGAVLKVSKRGDRPVRTEKIQPPQVEVEETTAEKVEEVMSSFSCEGRPVEVVFSFDTTGSMYRCLTQVRTKLRETVTRLMKDIPTIRIGIIAHGDYCDDNTAGGNRYVVKMKDLTTEVDGLVSFVDEVPSTTGGDSPECYEWVLHKAQELDWSEDSAKALVIIGDACPHNPSYTDLYVNWLDELGVLKGMGIKVYGVQALDNAHATCFYKEMSSRTGGAYLEMKDFQLITDMFLAVCYNEASPEQLQQYCDEIEQEGRMDEATKEMFDKLEVQQQEQKKIAEEGETAADSATHKDEKFKASWWREDRQIRPHYSYDSEKDKWYPFGERDRYSNIEENDEPSSPVLSNLSSPALSTRSSDHGKKRKSVWKRIKRSFSLRKRKTDT